MISKWLKKLFAWRLSGARREKFEIKVRPFKEKIFRDLLGKEILELGAGAGVNVRYYTGAKFVYLVEPNLEMRSYLEKRCQAEKLPSKILTDQAENLSLPDQSVEVVISSFVLCSVKNVPKVLTEIARVLKPGGKFIFVEHVGAKTGIRATMQRAIRPLWRFWSDGCDCCRNTEILIRQANLFSKIDLQEYHQVPSFIARPWILGTVFR